MRRSAVAGRRGQRIGQRIGRRISWLVGWLVGGLVVAVALAACTQSSHSSNSAANSGLSGGAAMPAPGVAIGAPDKASGVDGSGSVGSGGGAASGSTSGNSGSSFDASRLTLGGPSVIRTADLTVTIASAANVGTQADQARRIATDAGGSVDGDDRSSGPHATATLTLRVPPASLGDVLSRLAALGKEQTRHLSSRDVTTEVADVDSRVRSASAAIAQLQALYSRATRVSDVIAIETELAQRESDLEALQAQQRALSGQVEMATVTLYLVSPVAAAKPHHSDRGGVVGALRSGWHAFTRAAEAIVIAIGAVLPFLVLVLAGGAIWLTLHRRRRNATPTPPAPDPVS